MFLKQMLELLNQTPCGCFLDYICNRCVNLNSVLEDAKDLQYESARRIAELRADLNKHSVKVVTPIAIWQDSNVVPGIVKKIEEKVTHRADCLWIYCPGNCQEKLK